MKTMRGGPFLVWTGEVINTNDMDSGLDDGNLFYDLYWAASTCGTKGWQWAGKAGSPRALYPAFHNVSSSTGFSHPVFHPLSSWPRGLGPDLRRSRCG